MEESFLHAVVAMMAIIGYDLNVQVVYPNSPNRTKLTSAHLRTAILPIPPSDVTMCGGSAYQWLLQISVYVRSGDGLVQPASLIDGLKRNIPWHKQIEDGGFSFQCIKNGVVIPPVDTQDGWYYTPIQFKFQTIQ